MKYETYVEIMEALRFRENEMLYRVANPTRYLVAKAGYERWATAHNRIVGTIDINPVPVEATRQGIAEAAALWNGLGGPTGPALQAAIDSGHCRLVYQISHFTHQGKQAVNFRLLAGDARRPLADLLIEGAAVPRTTNKLAQKGEA